MSLCLSVSLSPCLPDLPVLPVSRLPVSLFSYLPDSLSYCLTYPCLPVSRCLSPVSLPVSVTPCPPCITVSLSHCLPYSVSLILSPFSFLPCPFSSLPSPLSPWHTTSGWGEGGGGGWWELWVWPTVGMEVDRQDWWDGLQGKGRGWPQGGGWNLTARRGERWLYDVRPCWRWNKF